MKYRMLLTSAMLAAMLSACGGGSGGVNSTPTPTPTPAPTPTNTTLSDLKASQSFTNDAAAAKALFDLVTKTGISGSAAKATLSIAYDAKTNGYTLTTDGRTQSFLPGDIASQGAYDTVYTKTGTDGSDRLTLTRTGYTSSTPRSYVGLGYWQRNVTSGDRQNMDFSVFTYGLATPGSAVPRTGTAAYGIDVFGLVTKPGEEPMNTQGTGTFNVDFAAGIFSSQTWLTESSLVSASGVSGGGIELITSGQLGSGDGTFSGNAIVGSSLGRASGTVDGHFYGPNGEELGGTFQATNDYGLVASGGFIGSSTGKPATENMSLTNMRMEQYFYTRYEYGVGHLNWQNSETFNVGSSTSALYGGQLTLADKIVSDDPNFTAYRKTFSSSYDSQDMTLELYKPGPSNTELALTYASFGHWSTTVPNGIGRSPVDDYFAYGFETTAGLLDAKTGKASYDGIAYGTGGNINVGTSYDVKGTSQFTVDFDAMAFTGALALNGKDQTTGAARDFGTFDVNGTITSWDWGMTGNVGRADGSYGGISARLYGPDGQEIVAPFHVNTPAVGSAEAVSISGIAAGIRK